MMWTDDPVADAARYDAEVYEYEQKCPICDSCGEHITDETYVEIEWKFKIYRYHHECADGFIHTQYTSDYIGEREV